MAPDSSMEWVRNVRRKAESSTRLVLAIVFFTNLLDNLLLTSVVPIVPSFLLHLDREEFEEQTNRSTPGMLTRPNDSASSKLVDEGFAKHAFSLAAVANSENSRVGWLLSSKAIVQLVANPFVGPLCSRFGYPILLFSGCSIMFVSSIVFAVSQTFIPLLAARSLQGLGSAASAVAGMSIVAERYQDDRGRSKAMGVALGGAAVGILGYPYGGFMYTFVGKTVPFLIIGALTLMDLGLQWFTLGLDQKKGTDSPYTPLYVLLQDPYILVASGAVMLTTMSMAVLEPTVPLWIISTMHVPKWQLGLVFLPDSVGYLVGTNFFGLAARSVGRWACTLACMLLISLCLFCLPFSTTIPQLILPHLGLGLGLGITDAAIMPLLALLVDRRHDSFYGCVYAIVQLAVCLAYSVGPSVAGLIVKSVGFPWLMRGMSVLNILFSPLCLLLRKAPVASDEDITLTRAKAGPAPGQHAEDDHQDSSFNYGRLSEED